MDTASHRAERPASRSAASPDVGARLSDNPVMDDAAHTDPAAASPSGTVITSVSTWQPGETAAATQARVAVLQHVAGLVSAVGGGRVRVAVDGLTAAGKSTFAHEVARCVAAAGRPVLRASLDDFKRPWSVRHLYDQTTGAGYYANAFDYPAVHRLLLDPAAPDGTGICALCSIDPLTQIDHSAVTVRAAQDAVLIVDGVFAFRTELNACWDLRIWLDVPTQVSLHRGVHRDGGGWAGPEAETIHRTRYLAADQLYISEHEPASVADVVIDNTDFSEPALRRR
jgi:uridine kinase